MNTTHDASISESLAERAAPWASSFLIHAAFGLLAAFLVFVLVAPKSRDDSGPRISIPIAVTGQDPLLGETPKQFPRTSDQIIKSLQDKIHNAHEGSDPFGRLDVQKVSLSGDDEKELTKSLMISLGKDASTGPGNSGVPGGTGMGDLALFGPQTRIGSGPAGGPPGKITGKKVVYLLDHSGSMLDSFDDLREEVKAAVNRLLPFQYFSVIMFSEDVTILGPDHLQRATTDAKAQVMSQLARINARGENDGLLIPFQKGFEKAFAMKPEIIIFLTDGNFAPHLVDFVKRLNKDHSVHIYTMAFVQIAPDSEECLKTIAKDGGGTYKFIAKKDLDK